MAPERLWISCVLLFFAGLFTLATEQSIITATQTDPSNPDVEDNDISAVIDPKEDHQDFSGEGEQKVFSSLEPGLKSAGPRLQPSPNTANTKYEERKYGDVTLIEDNLYHGPLPILDTLNKLQEKSEQTTTSHKFARTNNEKINAGGSKLRTGIEILLKNYTREIQNSGAKVFSIQLGNDHTILDQTYTENINKEPNNNKKYFKDNESKTGFKLILPCWSKKCAFNTDKTHNLNQLGHGNEKTVVTSANRILKRIERISETKRRKRHVYKEYDDKGGLTDLDQLSDGSTLSVTSIAVDKLKEHKSILQTKMSKACGGNGCKDHKDNCNGLSHGKCKDIPIAILLEQEEEPTTLKNILKFGIKEAIGLAMIIVIGGTLMCVYVSQGYTDDLRRYVAFGTLCFFLFCCTVLSELASRATKMRDNEA